MPVGVGQALRDLERRTLARAVLIRSLHRGARLHHVMCFAVDTAEAWLGQTTLASVADAPALDPRDRGPFATSDRPLIVVCTHGRRDPCCAERGRPLEQATSAQFPDLTWESTHVGGDRFAGNLVAFPHGLYFGHVGSDEGANLVRAYRDGRIAALHRYRGRSSDPFHVQAAEVTLRTELDLDRIDDVHSERADVDGDRATVTFTTPRGTHIVELRRSWGGPMRLTCHSERDERPPVWTPVEIRPL